jgi:hypothetical protein
VLELIGLAASAASTIIGYTQARSFTERRLRYVDAVHSMKLPLLVGAGAAAVAAPVVWLLPLVGTGTALLFGAAVGGGVAAGARSIRRRIGAG